MIALNLEARLEFVKYSAFCLVLTLSLCKAESAIAQNSAHNRYVIASPTQTNYVWNSRASFAPASKVQSRMIAQDVLDENEDDFLDDQKFDDEEPRPELNSVTNNKSTSVNYQPEISIGLMQRATSLKQYGLQYSSVAQPGISQTLNPACVMKTWRSPNQTYRPLYYEDVNLERYGNGRGLLQPFFSGAHFFSSTVALPYKVISRPAWQCEYSIGYCRPGNCNPAFQRSLEPSRFGAIGQALFIGGIVAGL